MSPDDAAVFGVRLAIITVGFVAGAVYLLQRQLSPVYGLSSFMFLAFVASQLVYVAETLWPSLPPGWHHAVHMVSYVAAFLLLPTFFIHLKLLSRVPEPITRQELAIHLALPLTVCVLALVTLFIPSDSILALKTGQPAPGATPWMDLTVRILLLLEFGGYAFVLVYIWLLFRWQRRNCAHMREVFANGNCYETIWTLSLAAVMAFYVGQVLASYFIRDAGLGHPVGPIQHSIIALLFILLVAIRGLQQAPGLYRAPDIAVPTEPQDAPKYSKSALAGDHAARIARKLTTAMADDLLYRDANLSLTKLAQHIGSSPNYVSQTLNEHLDKSFFDFVNQWRIKEAEQLLVGGEDTILAIAYEVGFNSRSAFYTAFKKHTGRTPTQHRSNHRQLQGARAAPNKERLPARP
ncbi:AraC family transcriptional regulator [Tateyamaria sp. syn59]|uniref:helix-turn-helix domain-containing protein n=1 Tax=Tateyamaria sp. syn59 TaxID=2576942 RepID=UPI0011BE53FC|nr:AraC family transcriptional regulator [Tateyamaria sp. syn59]